ncbi:MAG: hypothetical protein WBM76_07320 [Woeseiaceae bacterium]
MSEWLDIMLDEIARKKRESQEAEEELERRKDASKPASPSETSQSK